MPKKIKAPNKNEKALLEELVAFYWRILSDGDLKPADRIASARRLEVLLTSENAEKTPPITVTLNLPEGKEERTA